VRPGDVVITEQPTFSGSLRTLAGSGAEVIGISIDDDGINPVALDESLARLKSEGKTVRVLYTVPNFNNPTAALTPTSRRTEIAQICQAAGVLIVQDDAFSDLSLGPEVPSSYWSLAEGEGVVIVGTYSKSLAPGLRLGWIAAAPSTIEGLTERRFDLGVSPLTAGVVTELCTSGFCERHVSSMIPIYRRKRNVLIETINDRCRAVGRWRLPEGGFSIWIELASDLDTSRLLQAAHAEGVVVADGRPFFVDPPQGKFIRMCFSNASDDELIEAVARLSRAASRSTGLASVSVYDLEELRNSS
jgi:DNA-binding transcriptional MocR family regulator